MSEHQGGMDEVRRIDRQVAAMAAIQGGVVSTAEARDLGATASLVKRRRRSGRWSPVATGVFVMAGAPATELQRRWTAVLSLGDRASLSHEWAGRLHGLPALPVDVWSVTVPPSDHRRRAGLVVHQQSLDPIDRVVMEKFPVTSVPRTVCDLATVLAAPRLKVILEAAHFDLGWSFVAIGSTLLRVGRAGRPSVAHLSRSLDSYGPGADESTTVLEARLTEVLAAAGLSGGAAQHPLPSSGRRSGLVDRAFPEAKLIVEADGRRWHARADAMVADRQRDLEASRMGWLTVRVMHEQLTADPDDVAAALAETYQGRVGVRSDFAAV